LLESLEFDRFLVGRGGGGRFDLGSEDRQILPCQLGLGLRRGELAQQPLVERDGLVLVVLFAADFGEAEQGGGGEGALGVVLGKQGLVLLRGGFAVAGDFLGVEGVAQEFAEAWAGSGAVREAAASRARGRRWRVMEVKVAASGVGFVMEWS
jgi:hypothetical protein